MPSRLSAKVSPDGSASPPIARDGAGTPVVVTVKKVPDTPTTKLVVFALVIAGAWLIVTVKLWTTSGPMPLAAVKVSA